MAFIKCEKQMAVVDGKNVDIGYVGKIKSVKRELLDMLCEKSKMPIPDALGLLKSKPVRFTEKVEKDAMKAFVDAYLK